MKITNFVIPSTYLNFGRICDILGYHNFSKAWFYTDYLNVSKLEFRLIYRQIDYQVLAPQIYHRVSLFSWHGYCRQILDDQLGASWSSNWIETHFHSQFCLQFILTCWAKSQISICFWPTCSLYSLTFKMRRRGIMKIITRIGIWRWIFTTFFP